MDPLSLEIDLVRGALEVPGTDLAAVYAALAQRLGTEAAGRVWMAAFAACDASDS